MLFSVYNKTIKLYCNNHIDNLNIILKLTPKNFPENIYPLKFNTI